MVGPRGLAPWPWHVHLQQVIAAGIEPSPGLVKAAEHARQYWDAVLPTLPRLDAPTPPR